MRVLLVNIHDSEGGAARAAYRLHNSLIKEGVDSEMLVNFKASSNSKILAPTNSKQRAYLKLYSYADKIPLTFYKHKSSTLFSTGWIPTYNIAKLINKLNYDIVHLHWICDGMISIRELSKIKAPVVWSMHDMWAFTGGCHYDEECNLYRKGCGSCKVLNSKTKNDASSYLIKLKKKTINKVNNITVVGLSKWITNCAAKSHVFKNTRVVNLPNPIDTQLFDKVNKSIARRILNIPHTDKIILFGSVNATSDPRKGFIMLQNALMEIHRKDVQLMVFGDKGSEGVIHNKYKTHYWGNVKDDITLKLLYSASDVMIVPSLQENLSNSIMESLACGTPVVAFDIGGNGDMIEHQVNGYLSEPFNPSDLLRGIEWVLSSPNYDQISENARKKIVSNFDNKVVVKKYLELYNEILKENKD